MSVCSVMKHDQSRDMIGRRTSVVPMVGSGYPSRKLGLSASYTLIGEMIVKASQMLGS